MKTGLHGRADAEVACADGSSCRLWWNGVPAIPGERAGCIGAVSPAPSGSPLMQHALERLREEGCTLALAPMDGTTWHSYRFVTGGSDAPPFFLEPVNPPSAPPLLQSAGFTPLSRYSSSLVELNHSVPLERLEQRLARRGVTLRNLDAGNFEGELDRLFELSLASFADNFLYTPVDRAAFGQLYQGIEHLVLPDFVRFAEWEGQPVAFVFAVPDWLEHRRFGKTSTLVVKTLATHPRWRHLGLGALLVEQVQAAARAQGFTRAIHALQHETNSSLKITGRNEGQRFREYTLFSRSLR